MTNDFDAAEQFRLALVFAPGIGSKAYRDVLQRIELERIPFETLLEASEQELVSLCKLPQAAAAAIAERRLNEQLRAYSDNPVTKHVRLLTTDNVLYPRRVLDFLSSPPAYLFAYGNVRTLNSTTHGVICSRNPSPADLEKVERAAEAAVLSSRVLVGGTNTDAYQRAAVVPLRWGAPRILVLDRGLFCALGNDLTEEPFRTARLWRYRFDPETDLVLSRNRPYDEYAASNQKYRDELVVALSDEISCIALRQGGNMDRLAKAAEKSGKAVARDG